MRLLLRVLHISTGLQTGGAELLLEQLALAGHRAGQQVRVLGLGRPGPVGTRLADAGLEVTYLGAKPPLLPPRALFQLRAVAREFSPDLIQGWMYHGNAAAELARGSRSRAATLWTIHSTLPASSKWTTRAVVRMLAKASRRPAAIVYCSRRSAQQHEGIGYFAGRTVLLPSGVDLQRFRARPGARQALRQQMGVADEDMLVGLIARLDPVKGHDLFVDAAERAAREWPRMRWLMAGRGVDTDERLRDMVRGAGLRGRVYLWGERDDIPAVLSAVDVLTSCSRQEAFSVVIVEAMAAGRLCVATDVGDSAWALGETGITVPAGDAAALARAWGAAAQMPPSRREHLGLLARRRAENEFGLAKWLSRYQAIQAAAAQAGTSPHTGSLGEAGRARTL